MKSNKLKFTLSLILVALCLTAVALFAGCGDTETVSEIYITNSDMPRNTYVQGQDLDLSSGALTHVVDGTELTVPLTDADVTVTGYDKSKLGAQTITVTYMELSTTFNVTVIPRMTAEGYETKYFVDDAFDQTKGKLRIAKDDATTFTVNMNDKAVSLVSFDSTTTGERTVTVKYEKSGASYECSFTVNVYGIESVTMKAPSKTSYASHDKEIDFSGGYLTVKSTDTSLSKFVNLDAEGVEIEGFDLSAATKENRETPLSQVITIRYGGSEFTYTISIKYSGISIINDVAEMLSDIDWESDDASVSVEQGDATIEAMTEYYELSNAERALIPKKNVELIVRAAAVYVSQIYKTEFETYNKTIALSNDGGLLLICESYEQTVLDYERLQNEEEKLNVYATILRNILEDFPDVVVAKGVTVKQIVLVVSEELHFFLIDMFKHLIDLYELLEDVPADWTIDDLRAHGDDIRIATMNINSANYVSSGYAYFYSDILADWRTKSDYLDILYAYYVYVEEDEDFILDSMWEKVPLPGLLEDWYGYIVSALSESRYMDSYKDTKAYLHDVTNFMYYHAKAVETAEKIQSSDVELYTKLYEILGCDYILDHYVRTYTYGYLYHCGSMIDSPAFAEVWEKYLALYDIFMTDTLDLTGNDAEFRATLEAFSALSPAELYGFLTSLNFLYDTSRGSVLVTAYSAEEGAELHSVFIDMLCQYCLHVLNDANDPLLTELLTAMENYALLDVKDSAMEDFMTAMSGIVEKYNALSAADRKNFDEYLGTAYTKYLAIYNVCKESTTPSTGDKEAAFNEFYDLITKFYTVYNYMQEADEETNTDGLYGLMIALYERAKIVYDEIVNYGVDGHGEILTALYAKMYTVNGTEMTLDNAFFGVRAHVINYMFNTLYKVTDSEGNETTHVAWDVYSPTNAKNIFAASAYFMYASFDAEYPMPDKATMLELVNKILALYGDTEALNIFCAFNGDTYYYKTLRSILDTNLSENAKEIGEKLIDAEIAYISYVFTKEEAQLETFKTNMAEVKEAYSTAVTDADAEYLETLYNFYLEVYEGLDDEAAE